MIDEGPVDPGHNADREWLRRWRLRAMGDSVTTASSILTPVQTSDGEPAMLKVSHTAEEVRGAGLLRALGGAGAARVLRSHGNAVLLERAIGGRSLVDMVELGQDDEATRLICHAAMTLHAASTTVLRAEAPPTLVPLTEWFAELLEATDHSGFVGRGADLARVLLDDPRDEVVLHGDLHHGNVLDFGRRGWLAIDPKGLIGESAFDYCNLLCNPSHEIALVPGRLERQLDVVADVTGLPFAHLARWLTAWCALSSIWFTIDDSPRLAASAIRIGERAEALL